MPDTLTQGDFLGFKQLVSEKHIDIFFFQTSATDVLKAMGAMPSGFRSTTLGKMVKQGKYLNVVVI